MRAAARQLMLASSTLPRIKNKRLALNAYKKEFAPKYVKDQRARAKIGCRHVYTKNRGKVLVIDDESYFPHDPTACKRRHYYHAAKKGEAPYEHRIIPKSRFQKQYWVWLAIDENGAISDPFVTD